MTEHMSRVLPYLTSNNCGRACHRQCGTKENFGMIVDPLHLARCGGTPDDVRTIPRERPFFM